MTIIAAFVGNKTTAMASDSDGSNGYTMEAHGSKLHRVSDSIVAGMSGTYLLHRWIRDSLGDLLKGEEGGFPVGDSERFRRKLETAWDAWRAFARERGHGETSGGSFDVPGTMLLAAPRRIWVCQGDGSVIDCNGYGAVGSGSYIALGAMFALSRRARTSGEKGARTAVDAAIRHVTSCGGDVHVMTVQEGE